MTSGAVNGDAITADDENGTKTQRDVSVLFGALVFAAPGAGALAYARSRSSEFSETDGALS